MLEKRDLHFIPSAEVWSAIEGKHLEGAITSLAIVTVYYLGKRKVGHVATMQGILRIRNSLEIVSVGVEEISRAIDAAWGDFEDSVQAIAAAEAGVDWIVTRDQKDFSRSPVPSITPEEMLALLRTLGKT